MRKQRASGWLGASLRGASSPAVSSNPKPRLPSDGALRLPLRYTRCVREPQSLSNPHLT